MLLLVIVLWMSGIGRVAGMMGSVNPAYFILAGLFYLSGNFLMTLKLDVFFKKSKLKDLFLSNQGGMFLSDFTPARAGYYFAGYSLAKKSGGSVSKNFGILTLLQGLVIIVKVPLILISFVYFSFLIDLPASIMSVILVPIVLFAIIFIFLYTKFPHSTLGRMPLVKKALKYVVLMQDAVRKIRPRQIAYVLLLDIGVWLLWGAQWFFTLQSIGINASFLTSLMLFPILSSAMFIPLSPGGLGFTEGANMVLFGLLGLNAATGVAFVILIRINSILVDSIGILDLKTIRIPRKLKIF